MAFLDRFTKKKSSEGAISYAPVLKERAREEGEYGAWIQNHRWTPRNEAWSRRQMERFEYKPTIGVLMQCKNPKEEFLRESIASIFNQVYPFHELAIVDRGSSDASTRRLLEETESDSRVKISFQKGTERDEEAIAKIMKKAASEWLFLMGAEDILEPNALYNMVAALQNAVEIDFVYADSDLIDENGLRYEPQFKPIWAVGAHYPLGYFQHPILLHGRLVRKLHGHERVSSLMEEGTLFDYASNHSRYVMQSSGTLYHARAHGRKNETPPPPVANVLLNENYTPDENGALHIDGLIRIRTEPNISLKILWVLDSLDLGDGEMLNYYLARYLASARKHEISVISSRDGAIKTLYEAFAKVRVGKQEDIPGIVRQLHAETKFDVAFTGSVRDGVFPEVLKELGLPGAWMIGQKRELMNSLQEKFQHPATIIFPTRNLMDYFLRIDQRKVSRVMTSGSDLAEIKLFKQKTSPIDLRSSFGIGKNSTVFTIVGPTIEEKGQKVFVEAAIQLMDRKPELELDFFIVGERKGAYLDELRQMILQSGKQERFHFVPESVNQATRYPYFWISDVCVSCATEEVFPMTTFEAMGFKKAVIGPDVHSINEVIEDFGNGHLVKPGDPAELSAKFEALSGNKDLTDALGRESLEKAMERFALKKTATRLETLLRESIIYE